MKYTIEDRERLAKQWTIAFAHLTSEYATKQERMDEKTSINNFFMMCSEDEITRRVESLNNFSSGKFYFDDDE